MERIANQLVDKWRRIIDSIEVDGYSRKVESVDLFRMNKYYTGYPEIEFCYKVNFNFEDEPDVPLVPDVPLEPLIPEVPLGISNENIYSNITNPYNDFTKDKWHKELENRFTNMFWNPADEVTPTRGGMSGETKFENSKVDYMTNQGYRFIIQFYTGGFISDLREEKLEKLDL